MIVIYFSNRKNQDKLGRSSEKGEIVTMKRDILLKKSCKLRCFQLKLIEFIMKISKNTWRVAISIFHLKIREA